jgi:sporulation protein YlmC with PRC-barrel domain
MAETEQFTIGTAVSGTDGAIGKVTRVVVDPIGRVVTHLIVEPGHGLDPSRLVPLSLVTSVTADEIKLSCTEAEFGQLDVAEETHFLPGDLDDPTYRPGDVLSWPYYSLALEGRGFGPGGVGGALPMAVTYDKVPLGEVAVRRGEHVHATDGEIGRVQALVIDASDHHVTHVLLQEGHLWGRKDVAIPISAVAKVDDGIWLKSTKQDVQDLPAVDIDRFGGGDGGGEQPPAKEDQPSG